MAFFLSQTEILEDNLKDINICKGSVIFLWWGKPLEVIITTFTNCCLTSAKT